VLGTQNAPGISPTDTLHALEDLRALQPKLARAVQTGFLSAPEARAILDDSASFWSAQTQLRAQLLASNQGVSEDAPPLAPLIGLSNAELLGMKTIGLSISDSGAQVMAKLGAQFGELTTGNGTIHDAALIASGVTASFAGRLGEQALHRSLPGRVEDHAESLPPTERKIIEQWARALSLSTWAPPS
jgi:hypothetical protein